MSGLPYQDVSRPTRDRVVDLLARMTLAEKAGLLFHTMAMMGKDGTLDGGYEVVGVKVEPVEVMVTEHHLNHFNLVNSGTPMEMARWHNRLQQLAAQTRLGIPVTVSSDPRHAFANNPHLSLRAGDFSQWPETTGLAALRNETLVEQFADTIRREYLAVGIRVALHPQIDLATEPRWVRISGTFGEDAELTSRLARAYIRGLQGKALGPCSVAAMAKHFPGGGPQRDGHDPHVQFGREQVYPGDMFDYHLEPFKAAISVGCSQLMPYYGMPVDTDHEEVGFSFNRGLITGLLREQLGFDGIVCTDWSVITDWIVRGVRFPARAWGVEKLSRVERVRKAIEAGIDQFGGEWCPELVIELVQSGQVSEERINTSAYRILREKFVLGLFDNRYVNEEAAELVVGRLESIAAGMDAQRESLTILKNLGALPLHSGNRVYIEGVSPAAAARYATIVDSPDDADVAVLRLNMLVEHHKVLEFDQVFRAGNLELSAKELQRITSLAARLPTIVDVYLKHPAVLTELAEACCALVVNYGATDVALFDVLFGRSTPRGQLPFDLPSSVEAVRASRPDVPFDTAEPLFKFGWGLAY